jgi:hypothetical protein
VTVHSKDVALLGLAVDIAGAVLLARGFMMKSIMDIYDETRTRLGGSLSLVKSAMIQRAEAWGGAGLLMLGFFLQILAALEVGAGEPLFAGWFGLLVLLTLAGALFGAFYWLCDRTGRHRFYDWALRNYDSKPFTMPEGSNREEEIFQYGRLYDVKPKSGESAAAFLVRLNEAVAILGKRHRGKLALPSDGGRKSAT